MYNCEKLAQKCLQLIKQRFPIVAESAEFLHLSRARLEEILSFTDLTLGKRERECVCVLYRVCIRAPISKYFKEVPGTPCCDPLASFKGSSLI